MAKLTKQEDKLRKAIIQGYERLYRATGLSYPRITDKQLREVLKAIGNPPDKSYHLDHVYPLKAFVDRHKSTPLTPAEVALLNSHHNLRWCDPSTNMSKQAKHDTEAFKAWLQEHTKVTN